MRKKIKEKLTELEEEEWPTNCLPDEKIKEIIEKIRTNNITVWYHLMHDAHSYYEFNLSPSELNYDLGHITDIQEDLDFWKRYEKEEYYLLVIELSMYENFITSWWNVIPTIEKAIKDRITNEDVMKNEELKKIYWPKVSKTPPTEECKILQDKIVKILEGEGFVYITPEECDEEFNGRKLYDILFAYI